MFPNQVVDHVFSIFHPRDKAGFRHLFANYPVKSFYEYLVNDRIYCKEQDWNDKLKFHFERIGKESYDAGRKRSTVSWSSVHKRLSLNGYKTNTDIRTFFVVAEHMFLTNALFTFGLQVVAPNTVHVYKTTTAPIAFYVTSVPRVRGIPGTFYANEQYFYSMFLLEPHSTYHVPEGVKYCIVTLDKTFFSVTVTNQVPRDSQLYNVKPSQKPFQKPPQDSPQESQGFPQKPPQESQESPQKPFPPQESQESPPFQDSPQESQPFQESPQESSQEFPQQLVYVGNTYTVVPNHVEWGRSLLRQVYGPPKETIVDNGVSEEPLDLRVYKSVDDFFSYTFDNIEF